MATADEKKISSCLVPDLLHEGGPRGDEKRGRRNDLPIGMWLNVGWCSKQDNKLASHVTV